MTTAAPAKPHVSISQMEMYFRCSESWRRRYRLGEKLPPGIAMLKGSGLHRGAQGNFRQKIESHRDLKVSEIVDIAVSGFDLELKAGYSIPSDEIEKTEDVVVMEGDEPAPSVRAACNKIISEARDAVADMAEVFGLVQAPDYQPVYVEEEFTIELPGPVNLKGVVDLVDDRAIVVDLKTSGKSKPQSEADRSFQLTAYAAGFQALTGKPASAVRLDTIVRTTNKSGGGKTVRQMLESTRGAADFDALAQRINAFKEAIDREVFTPAPNGAWNCDPRYCGYFHTCAFVAHRS